MLARHIITATLVCGSLSLVGCAGDGGLSLSTGSLNNNTSTTSHATTKVSAQCVSLYTKIQALRQEGTPDRIRKVAEGKSKTVVVKRAALARVAELDAANAAFQAKCAAYTPAQLRAAAPKIPAAQPAATKPATTPAAKPATAPAKPGKSSAVTTSKKPVASTSTPASTAATRTAAAAPTPTAVTKPATTTATAAAKKAKTTVTKTVTATKKAAATAAQPVTPTIKNAKSGAERAAADAKKAASTTATTTAQAVKTAASATAATADQAKKQAPQAVSFPSMGSPGFPSQGGGVVVTMP